MMPVMLDGPQNPLECDPRTIASNEEPLPQLSAAQERRLGIMLGAHFSSVWRFARRMGLSGAVAEEITQEAFLVAARKLDQVQPGHERAFLFGVALRLTANVRRGAAWRVEVSGREILDYVPSDDDASIDGLLGQKQQREMLDSILASMSEQFRAVMILFEIEECSLQEIAVALGIPEGTAASRLRRARDDFARRVQRIRTSLSRGKEAL